MKYYTQFLDLFNNNIQEPCGSDSVFILDGRNTLSTMIEDSRNRLKILQKHIHPSWIGFYIMKGERFDTAKKAFEFIPANKKS